MSAFVRDVPLEDIPPVIMPAAPELLYDYSRARRLWSPGRIQALANRSP